MGFKAKSELRVERPGLGFPGFRESAVKHRTKTCSLEGGTADPGLAPNHATLAAVGEDAAILSPNTAQTAKASRFQNQKCSQVGSKLRVSHFEIGRDKPQYGTG